MYSFNNKRSGQDKLNSTKMPSTLGRRNLNPMKYYRNPVNINTSNMSHVPKQFHSLKFETKIEDSKGPVIEIFKFEDINCQDIYSWAVEFKTIMRRCKIVD